MGEFKNRNVIVTGASRGIGLAIAKKLAAQGANIASVNALMKPWRSQNYLQR